MQSWRSYLEEAEEEATFDKFMEDTFKKISKLFGTQLKDTGKKVSQEVEKEKQLDEALLFTLGVALAAPAIVKIFTGIARVFGNTIEGWTGKDIGVTKIADKIVSYADEAHHLFQKPIKFFVQKVLRISDEKKIEQATNILYNLLVAFLMIYSGVGAAEAAKAGKTTLAGFEGAIAAVKGGEVTAYLKSSLKNLSAGTP